MPVLRLYREDIIFISLSFFRYLKGLRYRRTGNIRIEDSGTVPSPLHDHRHQRSDQGFAYAAFSADHGNDIFNVRQIVQWFDQTLLRSFAAAAVCATRAVAVTRCAHFLPLFFPPPSLYPRRCSVSASLHHTKKTIMPRSPRFLYSTHTGISDGKRCRFQRFSSDLFIYSAPFIQKA